MYLWDVLNTSLLAQHMTNGLVSAQKHPTLPLIIYNYTQRAQEKYVWGDDTIDYCRGLIVEQSTNRIISRPFKKFHNLNTASIPETLEENLKGAPTITEKLDGSLGILWHYSGQSGIATRGSFTSPQAKWATEWYSKKEYLWDWPPTLDWTPLFEIIYKENRIVVDYDFEGLVLLGMVKIETGAEMPYEHVKTWADYNHVRCVKQIENATLRDIINLNRPNEEGFVVTYTDPDSLCTKESTKVKVKMADYVRLHKVITGFNPRSIWEIMSQGGGAFADIVNAGEMPEAFIKWLVSWQTKLLSEYTRIEKRAKDVFLMRPDRYMEDSEKDHRKKFSEYVRISVDPEYQGLQYALFDGHDIEPMIWKLIKPRGDDRTFRVEGE